MKEETNDERAKRLGSIYKVEIGEGKETLTFYFKKPHRHVLGLALAKVGVNPVEAKEILINNCLIDEVGDSREKLKDDDTFLSLAFAIQIDDLITQKKSKSTAL